MHAGTGSVMSDRDPTVEPSSQDPKRTVMVVDDSAEFLRLVDEILSDEGYTVFAQRDGTTAHQQIKRLRPALLILDVRMDGLNEWDVLEQVKRDAETSQIPVVVCSGAVDEVEAAESRLRAYDCDIVIKPFDINELIEKVGRRLNGR